MTEQWPPNKAWTSNQNCNGYRHFVALNYGGKGPGRWVQLVSVLDGGVRFQLKWSELKDKTHWASGWLQLPKNESNQYVQQENNQMDAEAREMGCLHPSTDFEQRDWN